VPDDWVLVVQRGSVSSSACSPSSYAPAPSSSSSPSVSAPFFTSSEAGDLQDDNAGQHSLPGQESPEEKSPRPHDREESDPALHQSDIPSDWDTQIEHDPIQQLFSSSFAADFKSWLAVAHATGKQEWSHSSADDSSDSGSDQDDADSVSDVDDSEPQELLAEFNNALQPLYLGCQVSLLAKLVVMFKAAARHKASKAYMQSQFLQCAWTLPKPNIFPTYKAAVSLLRRLCGIALVQYDSCLR